MATDGPFTDWLPDSPTRSPAWRWLRAERLHRAGRRPRPGVDDDWVARARRFLGRRDGRVGRQASRRRPRPDPAVGEALALWSAADPLPRWRLEARLLTAEAPAEVARRCGLGPDVVEAYLCLYFACRDRPAAVDWVMTRAVGCGPWNDFAGPQPGGLWKFAAATGGSGLLDAVIAVTTGRPLPDRVRPACGRDGVRLRLKGELTLALMTARSPAEVKGLAAIRARMDRLPGAGEDRPPVRATGASLGLGSVRTPARRPPPVLAEAGGAMVAGAGGPTRAEVTAAGRPAAVESGTGS